MKIKSDVTGLVKYDPSRKKFVFEYGGIIYRYYRSLCHFANARGPNRAILTAVLGEDSDEELKEVLSKIYGYEAGRPGEDWYTWKREDDQAPYKVLDWLESKGVIII